MDLEQEVASLRKRIHSLRQKLEVNSTAHASTSSEQSVNTSEVAHSEERTREPTSSELLKAKLMGKRSTSSDSSSTSS